MFRTVIAAALLSFALIGVTQAADAPTDPQIAHIAYTAGQLDIDAAKQALTKSTNPEVIGFAQLMERDHQAVNDQALALVQKLGVTPEDNPISQSLTKDAAATAATLNALEGAAYDKAYIENEIAYHQAVIAALTDTLIPATQNAALKALLEGGVPLFTEHLHHAEEIAKALK
jgi:putative membrane protein